MKNIFRTLTFILISGLITLSVSCNDSKTKGKEIVSKNQVVQANDVKVYYFHVNHRCATCMAVEAVAIEALKEYYGEKILFQSINIEEEKDNSAIEKYKVSGQTLLIIRGDKIINLTNDAFMNARTNPNALKVKIKSSIDPII